MESVAGSARASHAKVLSLSLLTRRNFLRLSTAAAAGGVGAASADAAVFEPYHPQLVRIEIPLARLPAAWDGMRIAQLSDFHYTGELAAITIRKAVAMVNGLRPDLIVLTGDFVTVPLARHRLTARRAGRAIEPCASLLSELRSRLGTYACLGNHDAASDPELITAVLQDRQIPVLINRSIALEQGGFRLWLGGMDDALEGDTDLHLTLRNIPPGEAVILLVHEPDLAEDVALTPVDLQLSGHSHGGQVRLPFVGAPVLPDLAKKFPRGLYHVGNLTLYTNAGIGTVRLPIRFNCPPEITLITLRAGSPSQSRPR